MSKKMVTAKEAVRFGKTNDSCFTAEFEETFPQN
jgi:hypothetical protein